MTCIEQHPEEYKEHLNNYVEFETIEEVKKFSVKAVG
jgi:hypothetical protein